MVAPSAGNTSSGWCRRVVGASSIILLYARTGQYVLLVAAAMTTSLDWPLPCRFLAHFLCSLSCPLHARMSSRVVCRVGSNVFADLGAISDCRAPV